MKRYTEPHFDLTKPATWEARDEKPLAAIFDASPDLLTDDEYSVMMALLRSLPMDGLLPAESFTPRALADALGQKHTGNMGAIFESLCRKGFITYWRDKNMFHVKHRGISV